MSSAQDFTCVFCSETFEDKESLQEHFRKHGDPKFNNVTKNKSRFESEQAVGREKSEESELVGCDVCDETFKSISKAITHKHKVHPDHDAKHFCPWCGKLFTMKHLYNKHMQSSHTNVSEIVKSSYHCDSCIVEFFVPSAMVYHNKFFHRQDSELPSIGHSKKVKTFNQEMIQIYYCPFCGEEYNNKVNLHKHMSDDHSDENQSPDEVLRCPLCDAVFYHLDAYELHLSFHSSEDIYNDDSEMAVDVTDFSLESVPPIMEKVEEETKEAENENIDKYLQLIMGDARDGRHIDGDKPKSKKHKKHKKSKKAAITLDEFLNMNKDVFGDGLDVQGIEEVPTQQVLKKYKGKSSVAKAIPASAIAKLKKQGITVKSNSGPNSPTFKTNRNVIINKTNVSPSLTPVKGVEKSNVVKTSDEVLSKLLIQGNNQIKVIKKPIPENLNKEKLCTQTDVQEPASSGISQTVPNNILLQKSDSEVSNVINNDDTNTCTTVVNDKGMENQDQSVNETCMEDNTHIPSQESISTMVNNDSNNQCKALSHDADDSNIGKSQLPKSVGESPDNFQKNIHESDMPINDNTFETNGEDSETNASDVEDIQNTTLDMDLDTLHSLQHENYNNVQSPKNKPLDTLKLLSNAITIKPGLSTEDKTSVMETNEVKENYESGKIDNNVPLKVARILSKSIQNVSLKKSTIPQNIPKKSIDALKTLNKQLTITPCVTSTTKCNEESEDESDSHNVYDNINSPNKNETSEKDNAGFKTPMPAIKQLSTPAKPNNLLDINTSGHTKNAPKLCIKEEDNTRNTFNMNILKRLTNVTAKPIARATNSNQVADSRMSAIQHIDKNKKIDEDIEIFNVDDSDSDQEVSNEQSLQNQMLNTPLSNDTKTNASANVLKSLSKNITIKSTNLPNKHNLHIKKEMPSDCSKQTLDGDTQNSNSNEVKNITRYKNKNIDLNHTLKKLGNNISIKSQYSSPDSQKYQMFDDDDIDDNFDMNDEESDSDNTNQLKITEMQDDDEGLPSDIDMEYNKNATVHSPHASNSENEDETRNFHSDEERNEDIEKSIKANTLPKNNSASKCLDNFKRNNKQLTIKSLNEKNAVLPQTGPNRKKQEEPTHITNKFNKDMSVKQFRATEKQDDDNETLTKNVNVNQSATTSSSSQKVTNQVNTVKTVKTFQSETIIEEITTTVTKTIRTVNQSSKQIGKNTNVPASRPRLMVSNQQTKPLQGMTVRNAPTVGTKIRNATPSTKPTVTSPKPVGQLVPVRPQSQIGPRQTGIFRPSGPGPSNVKKIIPQPNIQKPLIGKPLKISPLALNQTIKRAPENPTGHFSCFKRPKDSVIPSMDSFDDDSDDAIANYSSASSSKSDFNTTATKIVKGKSVVTATQTKSEQHSEQHITKLSNMAGLKIVRTSNKQASQVETKNTMCAAKRTTLDAIEKLQKQGLLIKKPRVEEPEETEHYSSGGEDIEEDYEDND